MQKNSGFNMAVKSLEIVRVLSVYHIKHFEVVSSNVIGFIFDMDWIGKNVWIHWFNALVVIVRIIVVAQLSLKQN
jgi:hypothetical protein